MFGCARIRTRCEATSPAVGKWRDNVAPHSGVVETGRNTLPVSKGAHIRVEGELRRREYDTNGGVKVRTSVIGASSDHESPSRTAGLSVRD